MPVALREFLQYGAAEPEHRIATVGFIKYQGVDALMEEGGPEAVARRSTRSFGTYKRPSTKRE